MAQPKMRIAGESSRPIPTRFNFTESRIRDLKPTPGKRYTQVCDEHTPGLIVTVFATGSKVFQLYRKRQKRVIREVIGRTDQLTVDKAREIATAMNARINQGADLAAERRAKLLAFDAEITIGELWKRYRERHLELRATASTLLTDDNRYQNHLKRWANRKASSITPDEANSLHATICREVAKKHVGKRTGKPSADKSLKLLRRMFNFAKIKPNPFGDGNIEWFIGKYQDERGRYVTAEEMPRFLKALEQEPSDTLRDYLKASLLIGQRRGNIQSMRWTELDLAAGSWSIPGEKHKTKRISTVPLTTTAVTLLRDRRQRMEEKAKRLGEPLPLYVFPNKRKHSKHPHIIEPRYALGRVLKRAEMAHVTLHDLRRTMGVWQAHAGVSEILIGASLGHRDREAARRYSRIADMNPVRAGMDAATNAMMNAKPASKPKGKANG